MWVGEQWLLSLELSLGLLGTWGSAAAAWAAAGPQNHAQPLLQKRCWDIQAFPADLYNQCQERASVCNSGFHQESFHKPRFKLLPSVGKQGRAACSAAGTGRLVRVRAERHRNSVAMSDHRSTTLRHGLLSARRMQVILPDKNLPPKEAPEEPIISFLQCLQFAG